MADDQCFDRRAMLGTAVSAGIAVAGVGTVAGSGDGTDGGNPARRLVVPDVEFFERGVVGQYVLVTDPAGTDPDRALPDCPFADWPAGATRRYQGLLLDRLTDQPHATRVPVYANRVRADVTPGTPYVVEAVEECDGFQGLRVAAVGVTDATGNGTADSGTGPDG